jgi:hypothetical protein
MVLAGLAPAKTICPLDGPLGARTGVRVWNGPSGQLGLLQKTFLFVVVKPLGWQVVEVAPDAPFHRSAFEGIGDGGLELVAAIILVTGRADVALGDPNAVHFGRERTEDAIARQKFVLVGPTSRSEHLVHTLHDQPRVNISHGQSATILNGHGFPVNISRWKRPLQLVQKRRIGLTCFFFQIGPPSGALSR